MAEDLKKGPADLERINTQVEPEVRYWTETFGCTRQALMDCVKKAGVMTKDVKKCLAGSRAGR